MHTATRVREIESDIKRDHLKAIIEGKTSVPFKALVQLILQRNVMNTFKDWGQEPIVISSDLLTTLASAPQDMQENRTHLVLVTLGVGVVAGVFALATTELILNALEISLGIQEYFLISGGILGLAALSVILSRLQRVRQGENIAEKMEKMAGLLSK